MLDIQMRKKQQQIEYQKSMQYISKYHPNIQPNFTNVLNSSKPNEMSPDELNNEESKMEEFQQFD